MGSRVLIIDNSHGHYRGANQDTPHTSPNSRKLLSSEVIIGDIVWIGEGAVVQQGCHIGEGSIIDANSVVTRDLPAHVIAGGIPTKIKKVYNDANREWGRYNGRTFLLRWPII